MARRYRIWVVVGLVLVAGCVAGAQRPDEPTRSAGLSLSDYELTGAASPVENRTYWDRSKTWENPGNRTVAVASRVRTYRNLSGADTVVVYTTPAKPYVGEDRIRTMSAPEVARLATQSVERPPLGDESDRAYAATLLDRNRTVRVLSGDEGTATAHVTRATGSENVVVVVVVDPGDGSTVERVLGGVTFRDGTTVAG